MKATILSAVLFAFGCTPELLMLADAINRPADVSDVATETIPANRLWMIEYNIYGSRPARRQYIFWKEPGVIAWARSEQSIAGRPSGSPWTFEVHYWPYYPVEKYTVYYDTFRVTNTLHDPEVDHWKFQPERPGLIKDRK